MSSQLTWLFIGSGFICGFICGRLRLVKTGQSLTQLVPTRTVRVENLKDGNIFKAAGSRLKRERSVLFKTKEPDTVLKKLADAANLSELALAYRKDSSNTETYKFYFREDEKAK